MALLSLLSLGFLALSVVESGPTLRDLGSDLTLLMHDDLQNAKSPRKDSGLLLLSARPQREAASACRALGEELWAPELNTSSIQSNLNYLTYERVYSSDQQYLIAPIAAGARAISGSGKVHKVSGFLQLPVLCTQTAPYSNSTYHDSSTQWHISVKSNNGIVTGFRDRVSFRFLGIRFAKQPKRFTYSTLYKGTGETQSALEYGASCVGIGGGGSEDCLFLNIWTPYLPLPNSKTKSKKLKPVMFHIHGGGASANDPSLDGASLASRGDVVAVAINYRENTFANLALDDGVTNGNFGFGDQITALDWVRAHIEDFGGDPDRITITGQSYGAISVMNMLGSPRARGKFSAAIPQSYTAGPLFGTSYANYYSISEVAETGAKILQETNCTSANGDQEAELDCLRAVPADTLASLSTMASVFTRDGTYLNTDRLMLDGSAPVAQVPVLMGYMRDDSAAFTPFPPAEDLRTELTNLGFPAETIINSGKFPLPSGPNVTLSIINVTARVSTDTTFRCLDAATAYAGVQNMLLEDVYFYEFNRSYQPSGWIPNPLCLPPSTPSKPFGDLDAEYFKCHSADVYYTFGTIAHNGLPHRDGNDLKFEQFIVDSWTAFARTYDPNPDIGFLKARGFDSTGEEVERAGFWRPVRRGGRALSLRRLQWMSYQTDFEEKEQCEVLGFPLDVYA